jgi:hypothetical protein
MAQARRQMAAYCQGVLKAETSKRFRLPTRAVILAFAVLTSACANQHGQPRAASDSTTVGHSIQAGPPEAPTSNDVGRLHVAKGRDPMRSLDCKHPLTLDVATQSVAGVSLDAPDSLIEASLPPGSVKRDVDVHESHSGAIHTIALCDHILELGSNGISTTDTAVVTTEGLHVGLPITRFDEAWGEGQLMWSEPGWVMYYFNKTSINAGVDACVLSAPPDDKPTVRRDCRVESIWISTPKRASAR